MNFKFLNTEEKRYYTCNKKKFLNKFLAIHEQENSKQGINFIANPLYRDLDCSQEPRQSLEDILKEQALLIRKNFKIVRLWYSGGIDSDLILDIFLKNKIHLDEIHVQHYGPRSFFSESYVASDRLESIKQLITSTKIIEHNEIFPYTTHKKTLMKDSWSFSATDYPQRSFNVTHNPLGTEPFNTDLIEIYGIAKPDILFIKGEWYMYMADTSLHGDLTSGAKSYKHYFYADYPKANIKQAHLLKNFLIKYIKEEKWNSTLIGSGGREQQQIINKGSGRLLYNKDFIVKEVTNKKYIFENKEYYFFNNKDRWGFEFARSDKEMWKLYEIYVQQCDTLSKRYNNYLNSGRMEFGIIGTFDRFYSLENNQSFTVDELFPAGFDTKYL